MSIYDLLGLHRSNRPDAIAAVAEDVQLTYEELTVHVDQLAKGLLASGVQKGDRVVTLSPPGVEFWTCFLAASAIGAIWSGLNPRYRKHEYQSLLEDLRPKILLVYSPFEDRDYHQELQSIARDLDSEEGLDVIAFGGADLQAQRHYAALLKRGESVSDEDYRLARAAVADDTIAAIVYTSGSTGKPKGAMLSHGAMLRCAAAQVAWIGSGLAKAISAWPINHVGSLNGVCMSVFSYGGTIIFLKKFLIEDIVEIGERQGVTFIGHNQTTFTMLSELAGFTANRMRACKVLVHGGSRVSEQTLLPFQVLNARLASVYAQTESCGHIFRTLPDASLEVIANTIGKSYDGVVIRIVDPVTADELPPGETGELQAKFDWAFSGYFNNEEATREVFTADGFLRTGDVCLMRPDGNVEVVDRLKQMYKSGGHSVFPAEIEQVICMYPKVAMAAVIAVPDSRFGQVGLAFVVPSKGSGLTEREIADYLRQRIANYKIPKSIRILEKLPLLPNTKVDRKRLGELLRANS